MEIRSCCLNADGLCEVQLTSLYRESGSNTYIAFGDWADGMRGPCVWFDGGSDFTACIKNAPVMHFNIYGECWVDRSEWMDSFNCPNLFNDKFMRTVTQFVQSNLPILYLLHNRYLDKEDVVAYLGGALDWEALLTSLRYVPEDTYAGFLMCKNCAELHLFCITAHLYGAEELKEHKKPLLCEMLNQQRPVFQLGEWDSDITLEGYSGEAERVIVPEGVCIIENGVFGGHTEIKQVVFPKSLREIGESAFAGCTGLELLNFPACLTSVQECAFEGCTSLQYVHFERMEQQKGDLFLEDNVFRGCNRLEEVSLPSCVETWGNPFAYCSRLHSIDVMCDSDYRQNAPTNAIIWNNWLFVGCNGTNIPPGVQEISERAFVGCNGLHELFIPDSINRIDQDAFVDCPNLHILCHRNSYAETFARDNGLVCSCED